MMTGEEIFGRLWKYYSEHNPGAQRIHQLLSEAGETIINDHIALRTFDDKRVNIDVLAKPFMDVGYVVSGNYEFPVKKLTARHYENKDDIKAPKVFISELICEEFSDNLQKEVKKAVDEIPTEILNDPEALLFSGRPWPAISYATYLEILKESEFAAWLLAYGYSANHFTISVNNLKKYDTLEKLNQFIQDNGYELNTAGGIIKGSPDVFFEQSSTMAEVHPLEFSDGIHNATTCYYEFARRYQQPDGTLFNGFITSSADKLFESTDRK